MSEDEFKDIPILDVDYHLREYNDIVVRLGNVGGFDEVAELCSEARNEIIALRKRALKLEYGPGGVMELKQTIADKEAEIKRLREALLDAANEVEDWGAYAGDYFKEKHDLEGCVAEIRAAALGEKE